VFLTKVFCKPVVFSPNNSIRTSIAYLRLYYLTQMLYGLKSKKAKTKQKEDWLCFPQSLSHCRIPTSLCHLSATTLEKWCFLYLSYKQPSSQKHHSWTNPPPSPPPAGPTGYWELKIHVRINLSCKTFRDLWKLLHPSHMLNYKQLQRRNVGRSCSQAAPLMHMAAR
jgi:hypothetical protein